MTLGPFGQHYTRNITWAEQAVAWNTYLARMLVPAAAGALRRRPRVLLRRGRAGRRALLEEESGPSRRRLRLRLRQRRRAAEPDVGEGRTARPARRHELSRARAARRRRPPDAAGPAQDSRSGGRGRDGRRPRAGRTAEPDRIPRLGRRGPRDRERRVGRRRRQERDAPRVRQGHGVLGAVRSQTSSPRRRSRRTSSTRARRSTRRWCGSTGGSAMRTSTSSATRRTERRTCLTRFRVEGKEAELWHPDTGEIEPASYHDRERADDGAAPPGPVRVGVRRLRRPTASPAAPSARREHGPRHDRPVRGASPSRRTGARRRRSASTTSRRGRRPPIPASSTSPARRPTRRSSRPRPPGSAPGRRSSLDLGRVKEIAEVSVNGKPSGSSGRRRSRST